VRAENCNPERELERSFEKRKNLLEIV